MGNARVDAINTCPVFPGDFARFHVVSRPRIRHPRRSGQFLGRVRFPAAPPGRGALSSAFQFADDRTSTAISTLTSWPTMTLQNSVDRCYDHQSTTPRFSRRREVGVKPERESVRCSVASPGRGRSRWCSIKPSTSLSVMRQVRPTRYPDNSPRFNRRDSQRTPSVISGGRTIFATSASEYVLTSGTSLGITHTLTCICVLE